MEMTPAEYYATHPDYRARLADGTPSVLRLDPKTGATVLEPVRFTEDHGIRAVAATTARSKGETP